MNKTLYLTLFGFPRARLGDQPLTGFATNKAQALLFYLAVTGQPQSRDWLATLLWDGMSDAQSKKNLRTVLPDLRRLVGNHMVIERQTIAFDQTSSYWLDVEVLRRCLMPAQSSIDLATRQATIDLYQGEFLSGFYIQNAPAFDAWMLDQREQIHTLVVEALTVLVNDYIKHTDYGAALAANRRLLTLEPWSESVHRQQMLLLAEMGERRAALAQYEACQRILVTEFGVEPLAETTALYEQIRTGGKKRERDHVLNQEPKIQSLRSEVTSRDKQSASGLQTQVAGHHFPQRARLYGRESELANLQKWIVKDGCRLVGIFGIGGQGKSALAVTLIHGFVEFIPPPTLPQIGEETAHFPTSSQRLFPTRKGGGEEGFDQIIWQPLLNAPLLTEVMQEWVYVLSNQTVTSLPPSLEQQFALLLDYLCRQRCLLILDNLESILQSGGRSGYYRPGYEAYGLLIRHLTEREHRSCLLLTGRERPQDLNYLEEDTPVVRFLSLTGLPADAGRQMLAARGLDNDPASLSALVQHYSGNPLALKLVAETVQELFDGNIADFMRAETLVFDDIRDVLDHQFARLMPLEYELMFWLAIAREPIPFHALRDLLAQPPTQRNLLEAVRSLQRRSLVEKLNAGLGLQNVVLEYTTDLLIENVVHELLPTTTPAPALSHLKRYALILAQTKEYVRASQTRQLLQPVSEHLLKQLGSKGAERQLQKLLAQLRTMLPEPGYATANLLHLLLQLGIDPKGYDFSQLYLRQAYLRGVSLPQTNFDGTQIVESVFTEPFGLVYTAVFSPDGQYVAAGTSEGAIYIWRTADQQLAQVIQAHHQGIKMLAFAQRTTAEGDMQLVLASASDDKSVGFWSLAEQPQARWHVQLVHDQQESVLAVGFSPDGKRVMSVDVDGRVFVWDVSSQSNAQLVHCFATHPTRFGLIAYSEDGQTIVIGNREGTVQVRRVATGELALVVTAESGSITSLALSRDGRTLVTGGKEGHLCFWAVPTGQLQQVIETKRVAIDALAFSADGKLLASTHGVGDHAIRLWGLDAELRWRLHHTLLGHTHVIWSIAFGLTPVAKVVGERNIRREQLVTGSIDQTVRVWDIEMGQSLYTLRGQPRALSAMAVHSLPQTQPTPSSAAHQTQDWLLAAVGYDQRVHLWTGSGNQAEAPTRTLRGSRQAFYAVAISSNGLIIAAAGHDNMVYLWNRASEQPFQILQGHTNSIYCLAFHPHGELLASGSTDGTVRLWSVPTEKSGRLRPIEDGGPCQSVAVLPANPRFVYNIAFSPDGRILATVGADRLLRMWDMTQSHFPELVAAGKTVREENEHDINAVAFSPDGTKLACGGNHLIHLWTLPPNYVAKAQEAQRTGMVDVAPHNEAPLLLGQHTAWILTLAFSPDGDTLVSGSADCTVCLWDVASGALRAILRGHKEIVRKVAFTPDGAFVLSCSYDGTIKFWETQSGECVNTIGVEGPYAGMNITGITGVTEAQKAGLKALGAVEGIAS